MQDRTILSAILDRVETCVREMVIPEISEDDLSESGYKLIQMGKPNSGYNTPLRACYRDLREVEALEKYFRIPCAFLLIDTGFLRGNQDEAPFTQQNYPINAVVTKFPVLLRVLMKQDTGQLVKKGTTDAAFDNYEYLTEAEWTSLNLHLNESQDSMNLPSGLCNNLGKIPITDQISNLLDDFDTLLNPYNLAGKQVEYPDTVGVLDAFITSVECLQGVMSPYEIVDYTLEMTFWQNKGSNVVFNSTDPVVSTVYS